MPCFTGKVAFIITGNWVFAAMKDAAPNLEYGVTYIPAPNGLKTSWSGGWSVVIPQGVKKLRAAYKFLLFVSGEEGKTLLAQGDPYLPTLYGLLPCQDFASR